MKGSTRRIIETCNRVLNFSRAHPNPSSGYQEAVARLEKGLADAAVLAARQREGINAARAATGQKRALRRRIRRNQLVHLARVAESAATEQPDLIQKFRLTREGVPYLAFRTAARGMSAEALNQKEILVKHGLLDSVLETLSQSLDQFDQAVEQGIDARRAHVGASAELDALEEELNQVVRLMDGTNHYRFGDTPELLAEWESASNVGGKRGSGEAGKEGSNPPPSSTPQDGEIRPAA